MSETIRRPVFSSVLSARSIYQVLDDTWWFTAFEPDQDGYIDTTEYPTIGCAMVVTFDKESS